MKVWSPFSSGQMRVNRLAPRKASLAGLTIGVLDNSKPNAGVLLHRVAELLAARTGAAGVRGFSKPSAARPAEILDDIAKSAHVVLTGSAD
ncbi:MAG TPA: hypothetical protein VGT02_08185 [Methylomirabilota bacterium]|jgi:hypothetical protein|nr:hypothetical protein [Methylomirabilota bacterium]